MNHRWGNVYYLTENNFYTKYNLEIDKVTYHDLSIFNNEEEYSLLHRINFCNTFGGKQKLEYSILLSVV